MCWLFYDSPRKLPVGAVRALLEITKTGYLKGVWPEIFRPVFRRFSAESDPEDLPRSPGRAPHINSQEAPMASNHGFQHRMFPVGRRRKYLRQHPPRARRRHLSGYN